jgi:hypothetical protein
MVLNNAVRIEQLPRQLPMTGKNRELEARGLRIHPCQ